MLEIAAVTEVALGAVSFVVKVIVPLVALLDPFPDEPEKREYRANQHVVMQAQKPILEHFYVDDLDLSRPGRQPCPPCEKFDADWESDAQFREAIKAKYQVFDYDGNERWPLALSRGVTSWPSFYDVRAGKLIQGYANKDELLTELGIATVADPPGTVSAAQPTGTPPGRSLSAEDVARIVEIVQQTQQSPPAISPVDEPAEKKDENEGPLTRLIAYLAGLLGMGAWYDSYRRIAAHRDKMDKLMRLTGHKDKLDMFEGLLG